MLDIDSDWSSTGREAIYTHLIQKHGADHVLHVGTFSTLGMASAAKDLLRVNNGSYAEGNKFTKVLNINDSWEGNLKMIEENYPEQWKFYKQNQATLDRVPKFLKKIKSIGSHAGGIVVLDKPVYEYIPVERAGKNVVTAFPESGQEQVLDELGIVKFDVLGISILDVIEKAVDLIEEEMVVVIEDGDEKIVTKKYLEEQMRKEYGRDTQ